MPRLIEDGLFGGAAFPCNAVSQLRTGLHEIATGESYHALYISLIVTVLEEALEENFTRLRRVHSHSAQKQTSTEGKPRLVR